MTFSVWILCYITKIIVPLCAIIIIYTLVRTNLLMRLLLLKPLFSKKQSNLLRKFFEDLVQRTIFFDLILLFTELFSKLDKRMVLIVEECIFLFTRLDIENSFLLKQTKYRAITSIKKTIYSF